MIYDLADEIYTNINTTSMAQANLVWQNGDSSTFTPPKPYNGKDLQECVTKQKYAFKGECCSDTSYALPA